VLFAGNHLSYLDVLVLGSQFPAAFVTSKEIQMTPFLGHICRLAACVFVDRQRRTNLLGEIQEITAALENGLNVMIFPEATSTNGEQILRFRRPLFAAAAAAQRPVVPFCINYRDLDGIPVTQQNRDTVCWYGDMSFLPHLWRLSGVGRGRVDLHILEPFHFTSDRDLTEIANFTHARVSEVFIKVPAS
jgi:1-acyl-sn-glycerol-3-phosphate acyltransferase